MAYVPLEIFTGEVNEHVAHVYARAPGEGALSGMVRGPFNVHSQTLPSNYPLRDLGPGTCRLARAVVTDPCTWSTEAPSLYRAEVESGPISFGIRRFGIVNQHFLLNGRRWVARGVRDEAVSGPTERWRSEVAARVMHHVDEQVLSETSEQGVMTFISLQEKAHVDADLLRTIARYASAHLVVLPEQAVLSADVRNRAPNLLLAQQLESQPPSDWADVAWIELTELADFAARSKGITLPIIAVRRYRGNSLEEARAACDTLQADLAPLGQFAGYVV